MASPQSIPTMLKLKCAVQNYGWGKVGSASEVAKLCAADGGSAIDEAQPYAELWMGTHPSGPSHVVAAASASSEEETLKSWIETHEEALGDVLLSRFGCDLPFLFKVLSVRTALSIQAHPDKDRAKRLHQERPQVYKDSNHKPEMALAITNFEALCGFVSAEVRSQRRGERSCSCRC